MFDAAKQSYKVGLNPRENKVKPSRIADHKTLNEASLSKVNWLIGFEEASNKQLFNCLWLCTGRVNDIVKRRYKETVQRYKLKQKRDQKLYEMLNDKDMTEEAFNKMKSNQITAMVSGVLKNAGILGNSIQSMMARNIRHFETIRKQTLDPLGGQSVGSKPNQDGVS